MNNLPNIITSIRLVSAVIIALLCFCGKGTALFLPLFIAAGISDMLDGFVARRFGWCTEFGATLDSVSDLILYMSVALFLCVHAAHDVAQCTNLILIGAAAQLFHWFYCSRKLGGFPAYHTDLSRILAYVIFGSVIAFWLAHNFLWINVIAVLWTLSSLEGMAITKTLNERAIDIANIAHARSLARAHRNNTGMLQSSRTEEPANNVAL